MPELKLVVVKWEDASDDEDVWVFRENPAPPAVVVHEQVGFLLELNDKHVLLTSTISEKLMGGRTRIPRAMVRKITYVRMP